MIELDFYKIEEAIKKDGFYYLGDEQNSVMIRLDNMYPAAYLTVTEFNKRGQCRSTVKTTIPVRANADNPSELLGMMVVGGEVFWDYYLLVVANEYENIMNIHKHKEEEHE